jgi:hypothetical protein
MEIQTAQARTALNAALAKASEEQSKEKKDSFFTEGRRLLMTDVPGTSISLAQNYYNQAVALGKVHSDLFMASVRDSDAKDHSVNVALYKNTFSGSVHEVEQHYLNQACVDTKTNHPSELAYDPNYENRVAQMFKPQGLLATTETCAWFAILEKNLLSSRINYGYGGRYNSTAIGSRDQAVIDAWKNKYQ